MCQEETCLARTQSPAICRDEALNRERQRYVLYAFRGPNQRIDAAGRSTEIKGRNPRAYRVNGLSQTRNRSSLSWPKRLNPSSALHSRSISRSIS